MFQVPSVIFAFLFHFTSLLFIKARLLNPASRNVHNIPLSWESLCNHVDRRYEIYQPQHSVARNTLYNHVDKI